MERPRRIHAGGHAFQHFSGPHSGDQDWPRIVVSYMDQSCSSDSIHAKISSDLPNYKDIAGVSSVAMNTRVREL